MADKDNVIDAVAVKNIDMMTTGSAQEEASVIALKLRQILEKPDQTAAVVTADRSLARRIVARLKHWQIDVEDGAGQSLAETSVGIFLLSLAQMAAQRLAPVPLLEALKHPLSALKRDAETMRLDVQALEDAVLHGPRPAPDAEGLKESLSNVFNRVSNRPSGADEKLLQKIIRANVLVQDLQQAGSAFLTAMAGDKKIPFSSLLESHLQFAEHLVDDGKAGAVRLWTGRDGKAAARFITELKARAALLPAVTGADYADVLTGLLRDVHVQADQNRHPRIRILTPQQAALHPSDITIVAGLNDEVWPAPVRHNPWLSPEMCDKLGLPPSNKTIGHAAHYFVQALSGESVTLSRATRTGSAPAAASPFLTRFLMVLKGSGLSRSLLQPKDPLIEINAALHAPDAVQPILPPAPCPAVELRPKQLPVTAIENLMRDPYSVYAKYVLNLRPKAALDSQPNVFEKGIFTHAALDIFVKKYPDKLPENAEQQLLKIGAETFKTRMNSPAVQAFWWPRFERIAKWFVKFETDRRELSHTLATEVRGSLTFDLGDGETVTLTAIVDRIDVNEDGQISIIDYKTGSVPTQKDVALGLAPQLTLEAAIALSGGFEKIKSGFEVAELQYWKLSGGRPAAEVTDVKGEPANLAAAAKDGLAQLIKAFNDRATPYLPTPKPDDAPRYNPYAHLARTGEWSMVTKTQAATPVPEQNNGKKNKKKQGGKPS
jgi:ATP-dependent helicase/nuclease subunit B